MGASAPRRRRKAARALAGPWRQRARRSQARTGLPRAAAPGRGRRVPAGRLGRGAPRGPRVRVPDEEALGDHGAQLVAGLGGRAHGPLELRLAAPPRDLRAPGRRRRRRRRRPWRGGPGAVGAARARRGRRLLRALPRQEGRVRGRRVPKARGAAAAARVHVQVPEHKHQDHVHCPVQRGRGRNRERPNPP